MYENIKIDAKANIIKRTMARNGRLGAVETYVRVKVAMDLHHELDKVWAASFGDTDSGTEKGVESSDPPALQQE